MTDHPYVSDEAVKAVLAQVAEGTEYTHARFALEDALPHILAAVARESAEHGAPGWLNTPDQAGIRADERARVVADLTAHADQLRPGWMANALDFAARTLINEDPS